MSRKATAFWVLLAVTGAVYATILLWSLPRLTVTIAGGTVPAFDLRPGGYTFMEAASYVRLLRPEQVAFYLDVQHRLDLVYPLLCTATLFCGIVLLAPRQFGRWRYALALPALPVAVFEYLENAAVAAMLRAGPDGLTPAMADTASRWTVLKSEAKTVAALVLLAMLGAFVLQRIRKRRPARIVRR